MDGVNGSGAAGAAAGDCDGAQAPAPNGQSPSGRIRRLRPGRPAAADLVFAAGAAGLVLSVVFVLSEPSRARLQARADEAAVAANAASLQLAVETHAAAHGGRYARSARELLPWLPQGRAPRNPYTGEPTQFRGIAGDLTYRPAPGCGYVIEAWGPGGSRPRLLATLRGAGAASGH